MSKRFLLTYWEDYTNHTSEASRCWILDARCWIRSFASTLPGNIINLLCGPFLQIQLQQKGKEFLISSSIQRP
ncbi:MAG: hypothetical protein KAT27_07530, partial [Desulfobacterales bacterium]|nr:hypothetical protein [Desulfobacterales bacterium]